METLRRIASVLDLDYAGIDFALDHRGRIVVFEANAAMTIYMPEPSPQNEFRRRAAQRIFEAGQRLLIAKAHTHAAA